MHTGQLVQRYTQAQVTSADRHRLLLLVFEGGQTFLGRAREALLAHDLPRFGEQLGRAQAIISELLGTLDHTAGGPLARDLARIYEFLLHHLTEANVSQSLKHVDEAIGVFGTIAGAFREILEHPATDGRVLSTAPAA